MKKKLFVRTITLGLISWMSMGLLTACHDDSDGESQQAPKEYHPINASTRSLRDIVEKNVYDPTEFGGIIGEWPMISIFGDGVSNLMKASLKTAVASRLPQMDALFKERVGTAEDGSRQWNLKRYVFTYKTVSSITGNDTTLIGSVIFPTNTVGKQHQVDMLTLYHHQAYLDKSWLPSRSVTLMGMHALHNSAVIEPDGQGSTFTLDDMENVRVGKGDLMALQMADCVLAALEVMKQDHVTLAEDGYANNWGTSLGATGATSFAQYMERDATADLKQLIKLRASFIGEGPAKDGQIRGYELNNPASQNSYSGWNPGSPFYIATNPDDEMISYDALKKYYNELRTMPDGSTNVKVHWIDYQLPSLIKKIISLEPVSQKMYGIGNHLLSATVMLFAACTVNDPADMEKALSQDHFSEKK